MNCKQGDIARVIYDARLPGCCGVIVRCVEPERHPDVPFPAWLVEPPLLNGHDCIFDYLLRPIRDSDGEDETITWAGKPEAVTA